MLSASTATGIPGIAALSSSNLVTVAMAMRERSPKADLVILADLVKVTGEPDHHAVEAAQTVGGRLAIPDLGADRDPSMTDFNDMAVICGQDAVASAIASANVPAGSEPQSVVIDAPANDSESGFSHGIPDADAEMIREAANLTSVEYDRQRDALAKKLGVRASTLDKEVKALRKDAERTASIEFDEVEPWDEPVAMSDVLDLVSSTILRFIVCDKPTADAAALWVTMSWLIDVVKVAPLAVISAPEKRCGKTQMLSAMGRMVRRPLQASNISSAALYRVVEAYQPTLLIDETDAFLKDNEDMRGIINSGHTPDSAYVIRLVGDNHEPVKFSTWGAKALSGIGTLADTIMDRAIVLQLRRKLPQESAERLRHAEDGLFDEIKSKICRAVNDHRELIRSCKPEIPSVLHDRAQDNWEPLLSIASIAGGEWAQRSNHAAVSLTGVTDSSSVGNELLADIKEVIEDKRLIKVPLADLIQYLCDDPEKSWGTYNRGKPITPRQFSRRLKEYGVVSKPIRIGIEVHKGYEVSQFDEAFARYLAPTPSQSVTRLHPIAGAGFDVTEDQLRNPSESPLVTPKLNTGAGCNYVTEKNRGCGDVRENEGEVEVEI